MKKLTILFLATFALVANEAVTQGKDADEKSAIVFVENADNVPQIGRVDDQSNRELQRCCKSLLLDRLVTVVS
jgi:hypothetical protein